MTVDEFIWEHFREEPYARWVLMHMRLPAAAQIDFEPFMREHKLFATHDGKRWRVTGASRLGDVWLASDFERVDGYDKRVSVEKCSAWGAEP